MWEKIGGLMEIIVKGESHGRGQKRPACHKTLSNGPVLAFLLRLLDSLSLHLNIHYALSSIWTKEQHKSNKI